MVSWSQTLTFPLSRTTSRLIFRYEVNDQAVRFMYDSGAKVPIWCSSEELLLSIFPDAVKTDIKAIVSGFGKGSERASVFTIPKFILIDKTSKFVIKNLHILVLYKPSIECDFILSESMFCKTNMHIFRLDHKELQIDFNKNEFFCTPITNTETIQDISVWSQDLDMRVSPCNAFQ